MSNTAHQIIETTPNFQESSQLATCTGWLATIDFMIDGCEGCMQAGGFGNGWASLNSGGPIESKRDRNRSVCFSLAEVDEREMLG